jgi:nucleotide-binding universal stress UspA family protein
MKKILVLFNGMNAPWHITRFALNMAKENNSEVEVLFLKDEATSYPYPSDITAVQEDYSAEKEKDDNKSLQERNIELFTGFCKDESVACSFEKNVSLKNLVDFTGDADIVITNSHDDFQKYALKDILAQAKCPVCLVSLNATQIKTNVLLYDGTDDATHAIETYCNLFPKLCNERNFIVTLNADQANKPFSKAVLQKFANLKSISLSGRTEKKLIEFLDEHRQNTMVVMGACGRTAISRLFKPSLSNVIINQTRTSLFIAHN